MRMLYGIIFAIYLALISVTANKHNYCGDLKCQKMPHVACDNPLSAGGFGKACQNATMIPMAVDVIEAILHHHNSKRNEQAMGMTSNYAPATRMATIQWDPELAQFAELNVRSCLYGHDNCMNTAKFAAAGQNIAMSVASLNYKQKRSDKDALVSLASGWFEEHTNGKYWGWMGIIESFNMPPSHDANQQIGHFTQVVRDEAYAIGCAASRFITTMTGPLRKVILLTCNYSTSNLKDARVYKSGSTASDCISGRNIKYPGLCSPDEKYGGWIYNMD